tara:strand:+ start:6152 stop:6319 length:168 start_codon:yes stop_codon:yes gene_type:complete
MFLVALYNEVETLKEDFSMDKYWRRCFLQCIGTHGMEKSLLMKIGLAQNPKSSGD